MSGVFQNIDHPPCHRPVPLAGWRGKGGVNILEDARHCSVLYICMYFVTPSLRGRFPTFMTKYPRCFLLSLSPETVVLKDVENVFLS